MLGETEFTLDIRPTFVDELDKAATYIERKFKDILTARDTFVLRGMGFPADWEKLALWQ